jgi:glucokinase
MFLGIEIGGTKLQLGVGDGASGALTKLVRADIDRTNGAQGILKQIAESGASLVKEFSIQRVGFGFGGPVDHKKGAVRISHQVEGWENFPLGKWVEDQFGVPARLGNDCDVAALAEYRFGAGRGFEHVFYVTVGTGVGGGCVLGGKVLGSGRPAIAEIGHLRPGLNFDDPHATVESLAAGPGIATWAHGILEFAATQPLPFEFEAPDAPSFEIAARELDDLKARCNKQFAAINAQLLGQAAKAGNMLARSLLVRPVQTLGWAIAQVVTLIAPEVVVVGGGVSLLGEELFSSPLRQFAAEYGFPPLAGSYQIVPAALGEEAVVHGAVALAAEG